MYDDIRYHAPFLKEVIARVDFSVPAEPIGTKLSARVGHLALERFPISEPTKLMAQHLKLSPDNFSRIQQEFTQWNYYGRDREKQLQISPTHAFVVYSKYSTFESLKEDFLTIVEVLFKEYPDLRGKRLGLRYINNIDPSDHDPFEWEDLINGQLLGLFTRFSGYRQSITRLFSIVEFKYEDDIQVKFQFGTPNPDFPATVQRPLFVLDIDAYVQGLQDLVDITANMDQAHAHIQDLFEKSITNELREMMKVARSAR